VFSPEGLSRKEGKAMKKLCLGHVLLGATFALLLLPAMTWAGAVHKDKAAISTDKIDVIGHLAMPNVSVTSLRTSERRGQQLLQLQDTKHRMLMLVDVTDEAHPAIVKQLQLPTELAGSTLAVLVGDVALVTDTQSPEVHISSAEVVNFADPEHPATVRKFTNVSAFRTDEDRGLIYLVDKDGLWILREKSAPDTEAEQEYSRYVFYSH
jgi:hypothetical protein